MGEKFKLENIGIDLDLPNNLKISYEKDSKINNLLLAFFNNSEIASIGLRRFAGQWNIKIRNPSPMCMNYFSQQAKLPKEFRKMEYLFVCGENEGKALQYSGNSIELWNLSEELIHFNNIEIAKERANFRDEEWREFYEENDSFSKKADYLSRSTIEREASLGGVIALSKKGYSKEDIGKYIAEKRKMDWQWGLYPILLDLEKNYSEKLQVH